MSRKTNKTTHVLNLLSNGVKKQEDSAAEENTEAVKQETETAAENRPDKEQIKEEQPEKEQSQGEKEEEIPGVSVVHRGKGSVADLIKESLEEELQRAEEPEEKEPDEEPEPRNTEGQAQEKKAEDPAPPAPVEEGEAEDEFVTVNVMERLVKERVPKYIQQFHICGCRRCLADVTALALTGLPAKYVVINRNAVSPLMNFYTVKYAGLVTVEVTKACMTVQAKPHHDTGNVGEKN